MTTLRPPSGDGYRSGLLGAFVLVWLALAIHPADRVVWALENILVLVLAGVLYAYRRELPLSRASCTLLFAFLAFHEVGAHFTYSGVPYDRWLEAVTGTSLREAFGVERNHFDRLIHLLFGLLLTVPMREALLLTSPVRRGWSYVLPAALSMAASSAYEIFEWIAAVLFGDGTGMAFLGAQGDVWDAQKDMALAALGAAAAMALVALLERRRARGPVHAAQIIGRSRLARAG